MTIIAANQKSLHAGATVHPYATQATEKDRLDRGLSKSLIMEISAWPLPDFWAVLLILVLLPLTFKASI